MEMKPGKSNLNTELITEFFEKQKEFKQTQTEFNELKTQFYNSMEEYFNSNNLEGKIVIDNSYCSDSLVITRIQNSKVEFNPDKLEKVLKKEFIADIIHKRYEIIDMNGLIAYLKSCGVDPKVFKSFLSISKSVDTKELDRLEELGKITTDQVKGCYTIKKQNPYFTVSTVKGQKE